MELEQVHPAVQGEPTTLSDMVSAESDVAKGAEQLLEETRAALSKSTTMRVPIAELSTLGAGVASLLPTLRTVTQTSAVNTSGLYELANAAVGDTLKMAKNGNFFGALRGADGTSKLAQLREAGPLTVTNTTTLPIDPATMLMAAALFSIEQQLNTIAEMGAQILSFLETEKESEIEADVETLTSIIRKYKHNWDNEHFIASNHKLVLDIQRTARKHMNSYQKKVSGVLDGKRRLIAQAKVNTALTDLIKKFRYYRLSLYTFSLASLLEILLSGNFKEAYVAGVKKEIETLSMTYRELFEKCSVYLEKMGNRSLEVNMLSGIGTASNAVGKFIGEIPVIQRGPVDEFLQQKGENFKKKTDQMEKELLSSLSKMSNPNTHVFVRKMEDIIQIYNHTSQICFDDSHIYLMTETSAEG